MANIAKAINGRDNNAEADSIRNNNRLRVIKNRKINTISILRNHQLFSQHKWFY